MNFLDTSVLVVALLGKHPEHAAASALLEARESVTDTHCLAEAFAVLTAAYRLRPIDAAHLILSRPFQIAQPVIKEDYRAVLERPAFIQGGGIYDGLHAAVARRIKVSKIYTHNVSNFQHHAPDLTVETP